MALWITTASTWCLSSTRCSSQSAIWAASHCHRSVPSPLSRITRLLYSSCCAAAACVITYGGSRRRSKDDVPPSSGSSSEEESSIRRPVLTSNRGALLATNSVASASSYTSTPASPPLHATTAHAYSAPARWSLAARQRP
ncbi:uncharacterized protein LOC127761717 [Oryza glaberrima]|uniref:cDNA clone:J033079N19, full insert sequence n=5 Tax=Oryza TaxID=4527 RepID=B7ESI8_ORYSJ|nr:uncharacterized protein LOC127761717 [Oryza glaberrima]BAG95335.1 unnamed protein product [Oryza sativa Japonica Group]